MWTWLIWGGIGFLGWRVLRNKPVPGVTLGCRGPTNEPLARKLAEKWGPKFGCPVELLMVIGRIESGYRPTCVNVNARALKRGGAWGMWQQTYDTGKGHAKALADSEDADVRATLKKWSGTPNALLDPDLNCMFAARQLGTLSKRYDGVFERAVGAYHQGAGKIDSMIASNMKIPDQLPPHGKEYVTRALKVRGEIG